MLGRILLTSCFVISLSISTFGLDVEQKASVTEDAVVEKARITNPKSTLNAQRFKSTRSGQVPLSQRVEVKRGVFQAKKMRSTKEKIKKLRLQPDERMAGGNFKIKTYPELQFTEDRTFNKRKRVGRVDQRAVATLPSTETADVVAEKALFSMADLNEFQYREDRSTDPGIPVHVAGGE